MCVLEISCAYLKILKKCLIFFFLIMQAILEFEIFNFLQIRLLNKFKLLREKWFHNVKIPLLRLSNNLTNFS